MNENDEKLLVAERMIKYGGSFVKSLGETILLADADNTVKLKSAFNTYWVEYKNKFDYISENEYNLSYGVLEGLKK